MENFYFCFDIGGTFIKAGVIDCSNNILKIKKVSTQKLMKDMSLAEILFSMITSLSEDLHLNLSLAKGIGIGVPGWVDNNSGEILFSGNLNLKNYNLKSELAKLTPLPIKIYNDAYVATLAELKNGAGQNYKFFLMITLGTGIGGGVVINGQVLETSCELGHIKISDKKIKCSCGEFGCFEALASTNALVSQTKSAMEKHPESLMWTKYNLESASGLTVFEFLNDKTAKSVFDNYIQTLGDGIVSLVNIFQPEAIIIGGAISLQKEKLTKPLEEYVNKHAFCKNAGIKIDILPAKNTGDAGLLGTKFLFE